MVLGLRFHCLLLNKKARSSLSVLGNQFFYFKDHIMMDLSNVSTGLGSDHEIELIVDIAKGVTIKSCERCIYICRNLAFRIQD